MRHRSWLRWPRIAWIILLPLIICGVVVVKELGRRERVALANYNAATEKSHALGRSQLARQKALYFQHRPGQSTGEWTRKDIEREFPATAGSLRPAYRTPEGQSVQKLTYTDPASYWTFEFDIIDDRWTGIGAHSGFVPTSMLPQYGRMLQPWFGFESECSPPAPRPGCC